MDLKVLSTLRQLKAKHEVIKGLYADPAMSRTVGTFLDGALKTQTYMADQLDLKESKREEKFTQMFKAICGLVERQRAGDASAVLELNRLRITTISNYVRIASNWLLYYRRVDLADDEAPAFEWNASQYEVIIFYRGQDGGVRRNKATKMNRKTPVDLAVLQSETQEYPTRDLYNGDAQKEVMRAQFDIGFDLKQKVDSELFALLNSTAFGAFVTTGPQALRTFHFNSSNRANIMANLPTTNVITLADNTPTTKLRPEVFHQIFKYFSSYGNAMVDAIGTNGGVHVPSSEATDLMETFTPTSSSTNATSADQNIQQPYRFTWGRDWTIIPDVTLALGAAYGVPTLPVGEVYFKPSQDRSRTRQTEDPDMESQDASIVIGMAIPRPWTPRVVKVIYHS